jgi:hypothetical protein
LGSQRLYLPQLRLQRCHGTRKGSFDLNHEDIMKISQGQGWV